MEILFVARSTSKHPHSGGMEKLYEDVASWLIERGHGVRLLTTVMEEVPSVNYDGVVQVPTQRPGRYSAAWWRGTSTPVRDWGSWRPEVIFSVSRAGAAMWGWSRPIVAQCHGTARAELLSSARTHTPRELAKLPVNACRMLHERAFYRRVDRVVSVSGIVTEQLQKPPIALARGQIMEVPNGVDTEQWRFDPKARRDVRAELGIDAASTVVISASRLHEQKGVDVSIRALARTGGSHLIVCGDGPAEGALQSLARALGVGNRTHFLGRQSSRELSRLLSAADIMSLPTRRSEGLPLAILEALANGLWVVTSCTAGIPSALEGHATVVPPDPVAVAGAWSNAPSREPVSQLPYKYTKAAAVEGYEYALVGAARPSD